MLRVELAAAGLGPDQVDAVAGIIGSGRTGDVLIGPAGTGKSYTVKCSVESELTVSQLIAPILSCSDSSRTRILWTATQEHSTEW